MQKIKIWFTDFWPVFNQIDNFLIDILKKKYELILDRNNPDFLFYSNFGVEYKKYNCIKIFFTGENKRPNFSECDYAFSFDYSDNPRNIRFPLYLIYNDIKKLTQEKPNFEENMNEKTQFCNFIYSNPDNKFRNDFFKKLSKYRKVDSPGRLFNNMPFNAQSKLDLIKKYKFTIAFENSSYPGYTTEKIFEPMLINSIPIYWGNPEINKDFNTKSFINIHDFENLDTAIKYILFVDNNIDEYYRIYSEPFLNDNQIPEFAKIENLYNRLDIIFNSDIIPISENTPAASSSKLERKLWMAENRMNFIQDLYKKKFDNFSFLKAKIKLKKMLER